MTLAIIFLLLVPIYANVPEVSATTNPNHVMPGLPEDIPREPMPENCTFEDFLNTTNPHSDMSSPEMTLDEVDDSEGSNPIYILVFGDEEEREVYRRFPWDTDIPIPTRTWVEWAQCQLERSDEALAANFGIDIRILGFVEWDSDDSIQRMYDPYEFDLWDELESDTEQYLGQWYNGEWWCDYVDAIIGITSQETIDVVAGVSSSDSCLNEGRTFSLLKWQVYWADENLAQHEVSHLYYADDHIHVCCAMAGHTHLQTIIWEDGWWSVFNDVVCAITSHHWCSVVGCQDCVDSHKDWPAGYQLEISAGNGGTTIPLPGTYTYRLGTSVMVEADPDPYYDYDYWILDGAKAYYNPLTVRMTSDHTLRAMFELESNGGGSGCPFVSTWNGTEYVLDNNLLIASEASNGLDVLDYYKLEQQLVRNSDEMHYLLLSEFENEHDFFDHVQLLAVDHSSDVEVAVSPYGEILTYTDPLPPVSAIDDNAKNVKHVLGAIDGDYYEGYIGSYITLNFGDEPDVSEGAKLVMRADEPPEKGAWSINIQIQAEDSNWNTVATVIPRVYWATEIIDLSEHLPDVNGNLKVRLCFTASHKLDFVGLDTSQQTTLDVHEAQLVSATHSTEGNVATELLTSDEISAELLPGQEIELAFTLHPQTMATRNYIIVAEGHYYKMPP